MLFSLKDFWWIWTLRYTKIWTSVERWEDWQSEVFGSGSTMEPPTDQSIRCLSTRWVSEFGDGVRPFHWPSSRDFFFCTGSKRSCGHCKNFWGNMNIVGSYPNYILHFEWSPPWHHIITYFSFFVLKSGEDEEGQFWWNLEPFTLQISSELSSPPRPFSWLGGPAVTTVIYLAKLTQTDSRYDWFETISDARASLDA